MPMTFYGYTVDEPGTTPRSQFRDLPHNAQNMPVASPPANLPQATQARSSLQHYPQKGYWDMSNEVIPAGMKSLVPYNCSPYPDVDLFQDSPGFSPAQNEAQREGLQKFGESWPMIRAQRIHSGDSDSLRPIQRRLLGRAHTGSVFLPIEYPVRGGG